MKLVNSEEKITKPLVWLEIDRKRLLFNVAQMKRIVAPSKIMAIVKANAYGCGAFGVARAVEKSVDAFGVVGVKEALGLRERGIRKPIVNLGIYSIEDAEKLLNNDISPSIFTYAAFRDFESVADRMKTTGNVWIKIDTGLGRLGMPHQEVFEFIDTASQSKAVKVGGVFSSFTEDEEFDKVQLKRFLSVKAKCEEANLPIPVWSIASSDAVLRFPESSLDMVRIGIALCGFHPSKATKTQRNIKLLPAVCFKTKVACVKELGKDESVFYRKKFVAKKNTRIAVLLPGYSYGLDAQLVNGGNVLIGGQKYLLVGGVGMTNCFVNIGRNRIIKAGDEVVIFGRQGRQEIKLEEVCAVAGQSKYEFLSRIPEKVERLYL